MVIYDELYNLVVSGKMVLPQHDLLKSEMINLQRKYTGDTGYKVMPRKEGEVRTDDLCDALAGACYGAINIYATRLPTGKLVTTTMEPHQSGVVWRSMQGVPYGVGGGQQVARAMENRSRLPHRK